MMPHGVTLEPPPDAQAVMGSCSADEFAKTNECIAKVAGVTDPLNYQQSCDFYKGTSACYPSCYCGDATVKAGFDTGMATVVKTLKDNGVTCDIKCGSASGLRATVFTGIVAALIAVFAAH